VKNEEEIRVTAAGSVSAYVSRAAKLFNEMDKQFIVIAATGNALTKAVTSAEIIKRRFKGLHQLTKLGSQEIVDEYEPIEEGLDKVSETRNLPFIEIKLSKEGLDSSALGYQAPIPEDQVKEYDPEEMAARGRGRGGGGRGKGRGKGKKSESPGKGKGKGKKEEPKAKGKGKGKGKEEPPAKGKGKGKGKGKEEPPAKGKGKGKSKGKGKEEPAPKGKGKGKGTSKGKGGGWDEPPPVRGKGKGKSDKGKGKSDKGKGKAKWDDWYGYDSYGYDKGYGYGKSTGKGKDKGYGKGKKGWY